MSKKNQIEEMDWDLCDIPKHPSIKSCEQCGNKRCLAMYYAERAYNAGYRKQSEGEWELVRPNGSYYCSCCGKGIKIKYGERAAILWDYCPNCGAHMRKEVRND